MSGEKIVKQNSPLEVVGISNYKVIWERSLVLLLSMTYNASARASAYILLRHALEYERLYEVKESEEDECLIKVGSLRFETALGFLMCL